MIKEALRRVYRFLVTIDSEEPVETVPIEEYNKVKQALEQVDAKVQSLTKVNETVTEELNTLQSKYRYDIVTALHECCRFKSQDDKKASIDSFTKSKMSFEEISTFLEQLRHIKGVEYGTKLPQKSIPEKRTDTGYIK